MAVRAGDADVGVAQDLLDHGEGYALLQEERGGGVPGRVDAEKYGGLSMNHWAELAEVERTPIGSSAYQTESHGCGRPRR